MWVSSQAGGSHTGTHTQAHAHRHIHTHAHTHTDAQAHTYAGTRTRRHTHTVTHTNTYKCININTHASICTKNTYLSDIQTKYLKTINECTCMCDLRPPIHRMYVTHTSASCFRRKKS